MLLGNHDDFLHPKTFRCCRVSVWCKSPRLNNLLGVFLGMALGPSLDILESNLREISMQRSQKSLNDTMFTSFWVYLPNGHKDFDDFS